MDYTSETPVTVLGQHTRVSLATFLQVMQALLWLEDTWADVGTRWHDFTYGLARSLYREKMLKRTNHAHMVHVRLATAPALCVPHSANFVRPPWRNVRLACAWRMPFAQQIL